MESSTLVIVEDINDLYQDSEVWSKCQNRWGQGSGFRDDVVSYLQQNISPQDTTKIYKKLSKLWLKTWENEIQKLFTDIQKSIK